MRYAEQAQRALDRLDMALAKLRTKVKNGQTREALEFMEQGELKDRYEELQNIITLSKTSQLGASGVRNIGNI